MSTTDPSRSSGTAPGSSAGTADSGTASAGTASSGTADSGTASSAGLDQAFDGDSLYSLRAAVAAHAAEAGLSRSQVYDVVAAAHELAANAVRHGAGHGRLRLHSDGQVLHCQVRDDGPAAAASDGNGPEPAPGSPPPWPAEHGHGLWMVSQVADQLTLDHGPAGTTATADFTVSPAR